MRPILEQSSDAQGLQTLTWRFEPWYGNKVSIILDYRAKHEKGGIIRCISD